MRPDANSGPSTTSSAGLRGQATSELSFDAVRVPAAARLGAEGKGFAIAMHSLDKGRVSVAAGCTGIVAAYLEAVVDYSTQRKQFGRPLASFQLIQDMIAQISVDADTARLLTWRAADLIERGQPFSVEASQAKYFASEAAVRSEPGDLHLWRVRLRRRVPGADVYARRSRDDAHEGTSQIQQLLIGRAETGVSAFL